MASWSRSNRTSSRRVLASVLPSPKRLPFVALLYRDKSMVFLKAVDSSSADKDGEAVSITLLKFVVPPIEVDVEDDDRAVCQASEEESAVIAKTKEFNEVYRNQENISKKYKQIHFFRL